MRHTTQIYGGIPFHVLPNEVQNLTKRRTRVFVDSVGFSNRILSVARDGITLDCAEFVVDASADWPVLPWLERFREQPLPGGPLIKACDEE